MSKVILITGASTGFGRDTAETLAKAGHRVFASMRGITGHNKAHADSLRAKKIEVVELDVTDEESAERAVTSVLKEAGHIDVLINNAGMGATGISESYSMDQVRALFDVNVFGVQRMMRAVLPIFRKQNQGLIVNIGSVLGRTTLPFLGLYGATKFALQAMSASYSYELSAFGIDVVLVQPSAYPTDIYAKALVADDAARVSSYGEVANALDGMRQAFGNMLSGENAPKAHDVAEALERLIKQPHGSRPAHLIVGAAFGADAINATSAHVQAEVLASLGLSGLDPASKKATAA